MSKFLELDLTMFDTSYTDTQTTLLNQPGNDMSPEMKTFYNKHLIQTAEPELVYDRFAEQYPIPAHAGKSMEFRRFSPLKKATTPLTEGVVPDGNKLNVSTVTVDVHQFGDFIRYTDVIDTTAIDNIAVQTGEVLGSQAGRTSDTITRDIVCAGTSKMIAPAINADGSTTETLTRAGITAKNRLTPAVMRKAVNYLERVNAKPFEGGYVAIIHPDTACDVTGDPEWIEAHKYASVEEIKAGEIGRLHNVRYVKSTEAKIIGPGEIVEGVSRVPLHTALDTTGSTTIKLDTTISAAQASKANAQITGGATLKVYVGGKEATVSQVTAGAPGTAALTVSAAVKDVAKGAMVCGYGAGADGSAIYCTMLLAKRAYATTSIQGLGLEHIFKQRGSGGTSDPLNQFSTQGWKMTKAAVRLVEEYMVRVEHSTESMGLTAESN
jgi:N4-gp56 family major capsid protein